MLNFTAWHPQTDGQSEKINQTIKITFRYYFSNGKTNWLNVIFIFQTKNNNVRHAFIDAAPNKFVYGFKINNIVELFADLSTKKFKQLRLIRRKKTETVIKCVSTMNKI